MVLGIELRAWLMLDKTLPFTYIPISFLFNFETASPYIAQAGTLQLLSLRLKVSTITFHPRAQYFRSALASSQY